MRMLSSLRSPKSHKHSRGIVNSHRSMAALCVVLLCSGVNVAEADVTVGGGNKADYTQKTQITGVNNTVTGTAGNVAKLNYVSGFKIPLPMRPIPLSWVTTIP